MHNWISVLFLLCSVASLARCCDWLRHYGRLSNDTLALLDQMGGPMTEQECPVSFPDSLYRHLRKTKVESRLVFLRDSLDLIGKLYNHDNMSAVTWDMHKMELFLTNLHRQTDELNKCVSARRRADKRLRRYYKKLARETLRKMDYSRESWELLRKQTHRHLLQLDLMANGMKLY